MSEAFYVPEGKLYAATELTRGPWDEGAQHAGPPAALLGRAIESLPAAEDTAMRVGRITYEILRPVPIAPLSVEAAIERDGRRVQMASASLRADGVEVMRARAWRLRAEAQDVPGLPRDEPPAHGPDSGAEAPFFPTGAYVGYHTGVEYGFVAGAWLEPGPATVWIRSRVPLVAGEEISPLERVLLVADTGNGVSAVLDWREFIFINVDLTVHLRRYPAGEWVCLDAITLPGEDGIALADTSLLDEAGRIGRAAQTLLVGRR